MKQVFEANTSLRRVICAVLVAIMVIGMIPLAAPKAAAAMDGKTLYIKPNGGIGDDAVYFAHFFNDGSNSQDVKMTENSEGNHYCTVPNGFAKVVIVRMKPGSTSIGWKGDGNYYNQTYDLSLPTDGKNCFQATGWNGIYMTGSWTTISDSSDPTQPTTPPASNVTAYLAGSWTEWESGKITMTGTDGKNASVTVQLDAGTYTFKIIDSNNGWHGNGGTINDKTDTGWVMNSNSNCTLKASGGSYTFTYNVTTNTLTVSYSSSGGSGGSTNEVVDIRTGTFTEDANKLYIGTTFYDYYTNHELNGNNLDSRTDNFNSWNDSYIFGDFNQALSSYYSTNKAKVPIYVGHFQPDWSVWKDRFSDRGVYLYGYKDGKAYGTTNTDQKWFMSVNNSTMNVAPNPTGDHYADASWGIVKNELDSNNNLLDAGGCIQPLFYEDFLLGKLSTQKTKLAEVYHNVQFPFSKQDLNGNGILYWVFDSDKTTLEMKKDTTADMYFLADVTSGRPDRYKNMDSAGKQKGTYGFFPFNATSTDGKINTYNYGFGARIDIDFNLTYDGKMADKYGEMQDIIFEFSGDDDVWVFIDGKLVLDIGGSHGRVEGEINFADMTATVSGVKTSGGDHYSEGTNKTTTFTIEGEKTDEHHLTMFYMERGMWESNMSIAFNFIPKEALQAPTTNVKATKAWNVADGVSLPANITLQLQHRVGVSGWENVGDPVTVTGTGNEWYYTFEGVEKFADVARTQTYEFRVVELDSDGSVLENGESNASGMIVTYGDVFGNGATGYEQVITNHKLADSVVVIDFGLSVDITVDKAISSSVNGTLIGVGDPSKLPIGTSVTFQDSDLVTSGDYIGAHGKASIVNGKIRYTPTDMKMNKAELVGYALQYTSGGTHYYYSTVTIIPAANIYYEDNFLSFVDSDEAYVMTTDSEGQPLKDKNGNSISVQCGVWSAAVAQNGVQLEDRPGTGNKLPDANKVYGYDSAYDNYAEYSFGATRWVVVDEVSGAADVAPVASFSFTGTGFDVVSVTDNKSGAVWVEVLDKNGDRVMSYIVNNYYGMKYENGNWTVVDNDEACLYQVPVIKVENLTYGEYDVNIRATYLSFMDVENKGYYTYYMDAIRIYNPAQNDPTSNDAYDKDIESNPHFTTIKNLLLAAKTFENGNTSANGIVFIDGKNTTNVKIADYAHQGPNNETYLVNGNGIAFKLKYTGSTKPLPTTLRLQIGAKLADGTSATLKINGITIKTLTTATNMFYKLPEFNWSGTAGNFVSDPIIITCSNAGDSILSLTDLKITGSQAGKVVTVSAASGASTNAVATDEDAQILAVFDMGVYEAAVNVMSSGTDVEDPTDPTEPETDPTEPETDPTEPETDPTEPETDPTEPETDPTEPETDPTEPETDPTEPETDPTEPETDPTEPETTVPETTAPQKDPDNAQTGDDFGRNMPVFAAAAFLSLFAVLCMVYYASRREERLRKGVNDYEENLSKA